MEIRDLIKSLKSPVKIVELISEHTTLVLTGDTYEGFCPFNTHDKRCFQVNLESGFFRCYGCHESGDIFSFVQRLHGISFMGAVKFLANRFEIALDQ